MKRIHLLRTDREATVFEPLIFAAKALGLRIGWLRWSPEAPPCSIDESLAVAAEIGALRSVAVERGRVTAAKPLAGAPVLRDVLREHFRGCVAVVVQLPDNKALDGESLPAELKAAPSVEPTGGSYTVRGPDGRPYELSADRLAKRLRRPTPFDWSDLKIQS